MNRLGHIATTTFPSNSCCSKRGNFTSLTKETITWWNFNEKQQPKEKKQNPQESWLVEETLRPGIQSVHEPEILVSAVQLRLCDQDAKTRWQWQQWADAIARHPTLWCEPRHLTIITEAIFSHIYLFIWRQRLFPSRWANCIVQRERERERKCAEEKRCIFSGAEMKNVWVTWSVWQDVWDQRTSPGRGILYCRLAPPRVLCWIHKGSIDVHDPRSGLFISSSSSYSAT